MNTQNAQHTAIVQLCSVDRIDACFQALCQQWKDKGANHSCWHLRFHWPARKIAIREQLLAGTYRFSPCRAVKINDHSIGLWNAEDTLVVKLLSHYLSALMLPNLSPRCMHIKGNGGLKQAVMQAKNHSPEYAFVLKSDVKSYYASMKHRVIIKQCRRFVDCPIVLDLLWQFLTHLDDVDGELFLCTQGIGKGSSLSPLLAALYLDDLDKTLGAYADKVGGHYIRYMDDWLLLCHRRWHLRTAVKKMHGVLQALRVSKAENKTFIGKVDKGFDWLGYRVEPQTVARDSGAADTPDQQGPSNGHAAQQPSADKALTDTAPVDTHQRSGARFTNVFRLVVNQTCINNHRDKYRRLYEQGASAEDLAAYVKRWWVWARGGVVLDGEMGMESSEEDVEKMAGFYRFGCC